MRDEEQARARCAHIAARDRRPSCGGSCFGFTISSTLDRTATAKRDDLFFVGTHLEKDGA